jgi:hypothetical protein
MEAASAPQPTSLLLQISRSMQPACLCGFLSLWVTPSQRPGTFSTLRQLRRSLRLHRQLQRKFSCPCLSVYPLAVIAFTVCVIHAFQYRQFCNRCRGMGDSFCKSKEYFLYLYAYVQVTGSTGVAQLFSTALSVSCVRRSMHDMCSKVGLCDTSTGVCACFGQQEGTVGCISFGPI